MSIAKAPAAPSDRICEKHHLQFIYGYKDFEPYNLKYSHKILHIMLNVIMLSMCIPCNSAGH